MVGSCPVQQQGVHDTLTETRVCYDKVLIFATLPLLFSEPPSHYFSVMQYGDCPGCCLLSLHAMCAGVSKLLHLTLITLGLMLYVQTTSAVQADPHYAVHPDCRCCCLLSSPSTAAMQNLEAQEVADTVLLLTPKVHCSVGPCRPSWCTAQHGYCSCAVGPVLQASTLLLPWRLLLTLEALPDCRACDVNVVTLLEHLCDLQLLPWLILSNLGCVLQLQQHKASHHTQEQDTCVEHLLTP